MTSNVILKIIFSIGVIGSPFCIGVGGLNSLFFLDQKDREMVTYSDIEYTRGNYVIHISEY